MNFNRRIAAAALFFVSASFVPVSSSQARPLPTPPPSGIVVHLFGPDSIMSNVVPGLPGEIAPTAKPAAAGQSAQPGQAATQTSSGSAQPAAYPEPSWGDVLHQMFIVGDQNSPPQPSAGRAAERQQIGQ